MEVFSKLLEIPFWSKFADIHGFLAMSSLILFGAGIVLYFVATKTGNFVSWLKSVLFVLFANLAVLDIFGLTVYIPYRAEGGPRTILRASEDTAWLHTTIFEHKEFLAFAPPLLVLTAFIVVDILGKKFNDAQVATLRKLVLFALVIALFFVLTVAAEGVIVAKTAPVE